jgi:hypothetical protein
MSNDRPPASRATLGAMRMPPTAARELPSIHAARVDRSGRAPLRTDSDRLSTVALMVIPARVR